MRTQQKPHSISLKAWAYVVVQAFILAGLIFLRDSWGPGVQGFVVAGYSFVIIGLVGIVLSATTIRSSLTAFPVPKEQGKLGTSGLYRYVRHPMYSSVLLFSLGVALTSGSLIKYGLFICLAILFYFKSKYEEKLLNKKYPDYKSYANKTPRLVPFLRSRNLK